MASQGPNNGSTFVGDSTVGDQDWTDPGNAQLSDGAYASDSFLANGLKTYYLKATGFGFTIPAGSTINGIVADVQREKGGISQGIKDNSVKIVKGDTIQGDEKKNATEWPTTDDYVSYGSSTDLWGLTWTVADINASNFGFVISAISGVTYSTAMIDHIRITVHYTLDTAKFFLVF